MGTLLRAGESGSPNDTEGKALVKVLFAGEGSSRWAALFRWCKGYMAAPHKHLAERPIPST